MANQVNGLQFLSMIKAGAVVLKRHVQEINDLNVFPVPDGDTGTNMLLTLNGGLKELVKFESQNNEDLSVDEVLTALANGMLLGARGNSGVIFSQLFAGLKNGFKGIKVATVDDVIEAFSLAVQRAYASVSTPVEGTILTVAREIYEKSIDFKGQDVSIETFATQCLVTAKASLDNTINLLPALKEANVVDSGGAGLYYFLQGVVNALCGQEVTFDYYQELAVTDDAKNQADALDFSKFNKDSVMEYGYCTECLLQLQTKKVDVEAFDVQVIIDFLQTIGDSIVAFKTDSIIKLHVHTLSPHRVLEFCQRFGEFLTVKIENMTLQHNGLNSEQGSTEKSSANNQSSQQKRFALVTVAQGEGLAEVFHDLGADVVISGGQTNNPSVEDFLTAFEKCNAQEIFVLPNNSNIIMAAENAISLYNGKAHLIKTKNVGQAYSILSTLDYSSNDGVKIAGEMTNSLDDTVTAYVTTSVRDANLNGVAINQGDYIGFTDKTMLCAQPDKMQALIALLASLDLDDKYFIIAVYGSSVTEEEKTQTKSIINNKYADLEFYEINGGQDVYDFILIIE